MPLGRRRPAYRTTAKPTPGESDVIVLESEYEARAWCASLGCSYQQLRAAMAAVGPSTSRVQDYLALQFLGAQ